MSLVGMKPDQARNLAAAAEVTGGSLAVQGAVIRRLLERWNGDASRLASFPARASWAQDQAKDIRRRAGLLEKDPEGTALFAAMTSVLDFWEEHKAQAQKVIKPLKVMAIMSGVEAAVQLQRRWAQGRNVAGARAVYDIRRYMGALPGNRKLSELISEMLKARKIQDLYKQPWKWQQTLSAALKRLKIPGAGLLTRNPPGAGIFARVTLPAAAVTGVKEAVAPTHDGAQGWVDRGMGAVQVGGAVAVMGGASIATALGASAAVAAAVPVAGWVALGVTGAYFLGSWAWDTWGDDIKAGAGKAVQGAKEFIEKFKFW
ncbi:hypothetical protein FE391_20750 [Nonomuraea sp. KC401]|uniref:hypothetical protein n=1 Tax=unclassified Nonomuraea TaxID=2593643 RepID=UPI0010FE4FBA|nr:MULTISPECIES: hypothetical protein [unclassified Nonomuraea]NBE95515.1 hypothetical protein [Nonomuraea sp. K271]TLF70970.1 hypothetical protein FE391_20750 [Nonomuraea sp. KC401]